MRRPSLIFALVVLVAGCGSSDTDGASSSSPEGGDGKYHPDPDGTHISEAEACKSLTSSRDQLAMTFQGCIVTGRTCPDLLVVEFGTKCLEYDKGSVDGCIAYYKKAPGCDALRDNFANCVITAYPDSAPNGCPAM